MDTPATHDITGLVLAGGAGRRMGGLDKGLQIFNGQPLALRAALRLQPQVAQVLISANRQLETYRSWGWPVISDAPSGANEAHAGPLAGMLAGLTACATPWLACVPCDLPFFPEDLVSRLARAFGAGTAELAFAAALDKPTHGEPQLRRHPTCCLLHTRLRPALAAYLAQGGRKLDTWMRAQAFVQLDFENTSAFRNLNTLADLQAAQA